MVEPVLLLFPPQPLERVIRTKSEIRITRLSTATPRLIAASSAQRSTVEAPSRDQLPHIIPQV
jgi:hypothetical protein